MEDIEVLEIDTGKAQKSIKDLKEEIKSLKDNMANMDAGSEAFREMAKQAGELQHQIDEVNESVKGASTDFGDMIGNFTSAASGIASGFQAANAAMSLMGVESKEVAKSIEKMQSLMALTQGLAGIDNGIKSFKKLTTAIGLSSKSLGGFKKALISTGLGALVVVLGSIIANWDEFTAAIGLSSEQLDKLGKIWGGVQNVLLQGVKGVGIAIVRYVGLVKDTFTNVFGALGDALKALFTGDFGGVKDAIKGLAADMTNSFEKATDGLGQYFDVQANYAAGVQQAITKAEAAEEKKRQEAHKKALEEKAKLDKEEAERLAEYRKKGNEQLDIELEKLNRNGKTKLENINREIAIEQERLKYIEKSSLEYEKQITKIENLRNYAITLAQEELDKLTESYRTKEEKLQESQDNELNVLRTALDNKLITIEEYARLEAEVNAKYAEEYAEIDKKKYADIDKLRESYMSKRELVDMQESEELERLQNAYNDKLIADEEYERLRTQITQRYSEERTKIDEDEAAKAAATRDKVMAGATQLAMSSLSTMASLFSSIADQQDAQTKEGFEKQKKLQISAAVMNMLGGILSAWVSAMSPANAWMTIWGQLAMGLAQTAATATMGGIQIAKIKNQQFDSGGSSSASGTGSIASTSSAASSQSIIAPAQYSQALQDAQTEAAITDTKVYVTESDISNTQNKVSVAESENTY